MGKVVLELEKILQEHVEVLDAIDLYLNNTDESWFEFFAERYYTIDNNFKDFMSNLNAQVIGSGGIGVLIKLDKYDDVCMKYLYSSVSTMEAEINLGMPVTNLGFCNYYINHIEDYCIENKLPLVETSCLEERYMHCIKELNEFHYTMSPKYSCGVVDLFNALPEHLAELFVTVYYTNKSGDLMLVEYRDDLQLIFEESDKGEYSLKDEESFLSYLKAYRELNTLGYFISDLHPSNIGISAETKKPIFFDLDCFNYAKGLSELNSDSDDYQEILRTTHVFLLVKELHRYEEILLEMHKPNVLSNT